VSGRLAARPDPAAPPAARLAPGTHALGLAAPRDALLHVPEDLPPDAAVPLVVLLHGAGSSGAGVLHPLREHVPGLRALLLAPDARGPTWDAIRGAPGPDVAFLDAALTAVFAAASVDPAAIALAGFSDGASYALGTALGNGDLVGRVVAFSPGFVTPFEAVGRPAVRVTHGTRDRVLPIDRCTRRLVPALRAAGYDVTYDEFDGGHVVPPALAARALAWGLQPIR
jgi:phospholipase/carboxylesterase